MPQNLLSSRTALITGASAGIGRSCALLFAKHGCNLVLLARDAKALNGLASELESRYGVGVATIVADVSDSQALHHTIHEYPRNRDIDICIANAGIGQWGPFSHSPWDHIAQVLSTNIDGALATAHAVLPGMCARGRGSLVLVSSVLGKRAVPWSAAYCASKYALHGFADALRLEVKPFGVHVGIVAPARTTTEFFRRTLYAVPQTNRRPVPEHPPERVASAILHTVLRQRRETVVTLGGKFYSFVGYHFPRTCDVVFSRVIPAPSYEAGDGPAPPREP